MKDRPHQSHRTRERIVDAFEGLIHQRSYRDICVADILEASGVGRTTFYRHFSNKVAVLFEMHKRLFFNMLREFDSADVWLSEQPSEHTFRTIESIATFILSHRSIVFALGSDLENAVRAINLALVEVVEARLTESFAGKRFKAPLRNIAGAVAGIYLAQLMVWSTSNDLEQARDVAATIHWMTRAVLLDALQG